MKKLYTLLLLCLVAVQVRAVVVTVNATGAANSYKTGTIRNWLTPQRLDGNIEAKNNGAPAAANGVRRGWAVFNLAGLVPPGATVSAVTLRFTINGAATTTGNPPVAITGFSGDMSTVTNTTTLYNNCNTGTAFNTTAWGTTTATLTRAFNTTGVTFIDGEAAAGNFVSICFNVTGTPNTQIYTITGENGTAATQPQLQITYSCTGVTGVTATASPVPVCTGSSFTLSGTASGAGSYQWSGPSGYTSTDLNPPAPIVGSAATAGTYTLAAFYPGVNGCSVSATSAVTTTPSPTSITGNLTPCEGSTTTLGSTPLTGSWTINSTSGATIAGNVVTAGSSVGATTVTYTLPSGCNVSAAVTTLDTPNALGLAPYYCGGSVSTLSASPSGGTWMANPSTVVSIDPVSGGLSGVSNGTANITYTGTNGCKTSSSTSIVMPPSATITPSTGSFHICPSLSTTLSNAITGGTWSASGSNVTINSTTGMVTGVSLGTSDITYSNTCGSATTTIYVDAPPPPITGTFSTCVNASVILHNAAVGGVWSSNDNSVALTAAGFGSVTGVGAGTLTITYTDVTGCVAITPFTVNPIPAPITGTASVCPGFTTTLSDTSTGATWSVADTNIAKLIAPGIVKGINASTTTITYTYTSTGCYRTTPFTVNPLPVAITGNGAFCALTSDTLHNLSLGGTWSSGTPAVAVINSATGIVTGVAGGIASITYTLPTGCYRVRPITIRPLPNPILTYDFFTETLSTGTFYTSYQWYQGGLAIPGANSYSVAATDPGFYSVYVTDTFGCEKMSATRTITAVSVNGPDLSKAISVHPNPTTGLVSIISPVSVKAVISSLDGKVVAEQANAHTMDISNLSAGMYVIMLFDESGNRVAVQKLIKE
ncbi:hypothetical protein CJD36_013210 [Flavipsychrobacter stenotrophus]|uniref:Secretion system C-terminal sorting domain-containing protein n=1 Tax=Flavipsychrobacter stenotrophus TaxID=2077091 RepID=A0A2S7SVJ5_9BACT|nr:T9SS type A sorting domain-containing protein [Flavipsychrobacter stenotrophus]PQJ10923.1 hypothetical protein CJD36_013210 [Flavipsychrobacter stenotrophus]